VEKGWEQTKAGQNGRPSWQTAKHYCTISMTKSDKS
jgi:hypothetical protein